MGRCMTAHARTRSGVTTTHACSLLAQESKRTHVVSSVVLQEAGLTRALRTRLEIFEYNFNSLLNSNIVYYVYYICFFSRYEGNRV